MNCSLPEKLAFQPPAWFSGIEPNTAEHFSVALSTRVRLARNLQDHVFPPQADQQRKTAVLDELTAYIRLLPELRDAFLVKSSDISEIDRSLLVERRLASRDLFQQPECSAVLFDSAESFSAMINEEDHLRIQGITRGFDLDKAWSRALDIEKLFRRGQVFAFNDDYGYLTSCATNVGTGLRASVMLQLPGLALSGKLESTLNGAAALGMAVRGVGGEGTESMGFLFQISNNYTLGETAEDTIHKLRRQLSVIINAEQNLRKRLLLRKPEQFADYVSRAYGRLRFARQIKASETIELLAALRAGYFAGLFNTLDLQTLQKILLHCQPGHLQSLAGAVLSPDHRDKRRAGMLREWLSPAGN